MQNHTSNIIQFPYGRSLAIHPPAKRKSVRSAVEKRLGELFEKYLGPIIIIKLYRKYITDINQNELDLAHVAHGFGQSINYEVGKFRECFLSLSKNNADWSIQDYRMVLKMVLLIDPGVISDNRILQCCIDELAIKISKGLEGFDRLYQI
jgi:hypothetical protein